MFGDNAHQKIARVSACEVRCTVYTHTRRSQGNRLLQINFEINGCFSYFEEGPPRLRSCPLPMKTKVNLTMLANSTATLLDDVLGMASGESGRRIAWLFSLLSQVLDGFRGLQVVFPFVHR